jgi:hypothetical protein
MFWNMGGRRRPRPYSILYVCQNSSSNHLSNKRKYSAFMVVPQADGAKRGGGARQCDAPCRVAQNRGPLNTILRRITIMFDKPINDAILEGNLNVVWDLLNLQPTCKTLNITLSTMCPHQRSPVLQGASLPQRRWKWYVICRDSGRTWRQLFSIHPPYWDAKFPNLFARAASK